MIRFLIPEDSDSEDSENLRGKNIYNFSLHLDVFSILIKLHFLKYN